MSEQNKAVVRRLLDEFITGGNTAVFDEIVAPDVMEHEDMGPDVPKNAEGVKMFFAAFRLAFPDIRASVDDLIAEGDKVVVRGTWTGTHLGEFMGIPATGNAVNFGVMDEFRISGGKIKEHWGLMDAMSLMQQIGAMPG